MAIEYYTSSIVTIVTMHTAHREGEGGGHRLAGNLHGHTILY